MAVLASRDLKEGLLVGLNETRKTVENAEIRARFDPKKCDTKVFSKNNREYAQGLHREADQLYRSGDYESALVLYHRAANLYPKDSSHGVAARRTAATISSCNNPSRALRKVLPTSGTGERLTVALCPETAAIMANEKLKNSPEPSSIGELLSYFDNHKSYWRTLPSPRISNAQLARSKMMLKQLNNLAETSLRNLQAAFDAGKMSAALKIGQELLVLSGGFQDPTRYQIAAYHYLSMIHVAFGRHDRAVCNVSRLVRLSRSTGDVVQICRSLVTLGKVHLSFGHLDAAAKAWEHLSKDLKSPIPVAWIRHEIGRCYLETGKYAKAVEMGFWCVDAAIKGNSKKWMLNGRLLLGQSLAKLGRFVEALEELQIAAKITEEEGDTPMLSYIRDLIDQVAGALRRIPFVNGCWEVVESAISHGRKPHRDHSMFIGRQETVITTVLAPSKMIAECHEEEESSSEETSDNDADEEITMHSDNRVSLMTYRESTARSNPEELQQIAAGNSTFRVEQQKDVSSSSTSLSSSSSSSNLDDLEEEKEGISRGNSKGNEDIQMASLKVSAKIVGDNLQEDDDALNRGTVSEVSLRSINTTDTYVIDDESVAGNANAENNEGIMERRGMEKIVGYGNIDEQNGDMLNALRVIEELGKNDEMELLEMLKDMMLATDVKGQLSDFGNSGDGFLTARSGKDRRKEVVTGPSIRHSSLPTSPRKCDAHGDSRDHKTSLESNS